MHNSRKPFIKKGRQSIVLTEAAAARVTGLNFCPYCILCHFLTNFWREKSRKNCWSSIRNTLMAVGTGCGEQSTDFSTVLLETYNLKHFFGVSLIVLKLARKETTHESKDKNSHRIVGSFLRLIWLELKGNWLKIVRLPFLLFNLGERVFFTNGHTRANFRLEIHRNVVRPTPKLLQITPIHKCLSSGLLFSLSFHSLFSA